MHIEHRYSLTYAYQSFLQLKENYLIFTDKRLKIKSIFLKCFQERFFLL